MLELPEVESGFSCCSLMFASVREALFEQVELSLVFAISRCQSSALLSGVISLCQQARVG